MLENEKLNIVDDDLVASIYKAIEIFDIIKNTRIKINNKLINSMDKKYLSLLLGIYYKENEASKILHLLRYNYDIEVFTSVKNQGEYEKIYNEQFSDIVDSLINVEDSCVEKLMLQLLEVDFIKKLHNDKGLSLIPLKLLLHESLENKEKTKILQKTKNVLL